MGLGKLKSSYCTVSPVHEAAAFLLTLKRAPTTSWSIAYFATICSFTKVAHDLLSAAKFDKWIGIAYLSL